MRLTRAGWTALLAIVFFLPVQCWASQGPANAKEATSNSSRPIARAVSENEPQRDRSQIEKQTDLDQATRLGRATHERMSAFDRLPKFYITSNNVGLFDRFYLEAPSEDWLDNLIRSLDLDTRGKKTGQVHDQFGWDENHFLRATGDNDKELISFWGTREIAGSSSNMRTPRRTTLHRDVQEAWASTWNLRSNYMRASPHLFWFGASSRYRSFSRNCLPANIATYEQLADMSFDGELCQVVRSTVRQEMLIISKASGLLRGDSAEATD